MSHKQWGHGYYSGIKAAREEDAHLPEEIEKMAASAVLQMCRVNASKTEDRSLYSVRDFITTCKAIGIAEGDTKSIYKSIMSNNPFGAYVSGYPKSDWKDDFFVLPIMPEEDMRESCLASGCG